MPTPLTLQRDFVQNVIGDRSLFCYGTRGIDALSLTDLLPCTTNISLIAPGEPRKEGVQTISIEEMSGIRNRMADFSLEKNPSSKAFLDAILRAATNPNGSLVCMQSPSEEIDELSIRTGGRMQILGFTKAQQRPFLNKSWVEIELTKRKVTTLPQRYFARHEMEEIRSLFADSPVVVRKYCRASGDGIDIMYSFDEAQKFLDDVSHDAIISASPYLEGGLPICMSGAVWDNGDVTLYPGNVQITGIPGATPRPLGYCGTDIGAYRRLDRSITHKMEELTRSVGEWLHRYGYRGLFGVDALWYNDKLYFVELNPRTVGPTDLLSDEMQRQGFPGPLLDHLAAQLGGRSLQQLSVEDLQEMVGDVSRMVLLSACEDKTGEIAQLRSLSTKEDMLPPAGIVVEDLAVRSRLYFPYSLTTDGYSLDLPQVIDIESAVQPLTPDLVGDPALGLSGVASS